MARKPTYKELEQRLDKVKGPAIELERVKQALDENEKTCRGILENMLDVYYRTDLHGNVVLLSPSALEIFGYDTLDELIGKKLATDFYYEPDDREIFLKDLRKEGKLTGYEVTLKRKDGTRIQVETSSQFVYDESGKPVGVEGVIRDITDRKRAESERRKSEASVRALLNASIDPVFLCDHQGIVLAANEAMANGFGKRVDEILNVNVIDLLPPDLAKTRKAKGAKVFRSGKLVRWEDERNGRIFDTVAYPVFGRQGNVSLVAVFGRDITSERKAQEALKQREASLKAKTTELKEVNRALRALLRQRGEDRKETEERVLANVKELALPYMEKLKKSPLDAQQAVYLKILESNLNEIVAPFIHELSSKYTKLTPTEIQIVHLIREGKPTKEIAELFGSSKRTIESHRENIRIKLGLKNKKVNLRSYLSSM